MKQTRDTGQRFVAFRNSEIQSLERRLYLRQGLSLGAVLMLTGCNVTDQQQVARTLGNMSDWNDRVQGRLFDPAKLAQEYPESAIAQPFPFNAFSGEDEVPIIDMATALHPQTLLAFRYADQILPARYGFPMKLRVPTKLGFKNPKHIQAIFATNEYPGGCWEDQGYNWFSGS